MYRDEGLKTTKDADQTADWKVEMSEATFQEFRDYGWDMDRVRVPLRSAVAGYAGETRPVV